MQLSIRQSLTVLVGLVVSALVLTLLPVAPAEAANGDITIADATVAEEDTGTKTVTITVTAEGVASNGTQVSWFTEQGSATANVDYQTANGRVTLNTPGLDGATPVNRGTFTVTIINDDLAEGDETFGIVLRDPSAGQITDRVGQVTITDDDGGGATPTFSVIDTSLIEGQGSATVQISMTPAAAEAESVRVVLSDDTATNGSDYNDTMPVVGRTVNFAAGATSGSFTIPITDDDTFEGNERFRVALSQNSAGTLIGRTPGFVTIIEDEEVPAISINDDTKDEDANNATGLFEFTATIPKPATIDIAMDWRLRDGTATLADKDYVAATGRLTIPAGDTESNTISFRAEDDANVEADETFDVVLSNPTAPAIFEKAVGVATIPNNDVGDRTISVDDSVATVVEGDDPAQTDVFLEFPVVLNGYTDKHTPNETNDITVAWRVTGESDGDGQADYDTTVTGTVTIPEGAVVSTTPIRIPIIGDLRVEDDDPVVVLLDVASPTGPGVVASDNGGEGTILDDDPNLVISDASITEGDNGTKRLTAIVTLSSPTTYDVLVDYDTSTGSDDNATAGTDYTAVPEGTRAEGNGTIRFEGADGEEGSPATGQTRGILDVKISGDTTVEEDETFTVTLSNARTEGTDNPIHVSDAVATLTITNDDVEGTDPEPEPKKLTVNAGPDRTVESATALSFTAATTDATGAVSVAWNFGDGGTATGAAVSHVFKASGTFTVTATATDSNGTATDTAKVTVTDTGVATRSAGETRELTAVQVARDHWTTAPTVVLATSQNFPDALAAGPYAATLDAPLLLTPPSGLPDAVSDALDDLQTTRVVILGGTAAVPQAIEDALIARGFAVTRIEGQDRFHTAAALARQVGAPDKVAVVALGAAANPSRAWPDALGAGGYASLPNPLPVLLSQTDDVPDITIKTLLDLGVTDINLLGGIVALSVGVEKQLTDAGFRVNRLAGADRYETSVLVAADVLVRFGEAQARPVFVTGQNFPDGLAAGALAARIGGPVVLIPRDELPANTEFFLRANADQLDAPVFLGGEVAITERNKGNVTRAVDKSSTL